MGNVPPEAPGRGGQKLRKQAPAPVRLPPTIVPLSSIPSLPSMLTIAHDTLVIGHQDGSICLARLPMHLQRYAGLDTSRPAEALSLLLADDDLPCVFLPSPATLTEYLLDATLPDHIAREALRADITRQLPSVQFESYPAQVLSVFLLPLRTTAAPRTTPDVLLAAVYPWGFALFTPFSVLPLVCVPLARFPTTLLPAYVTPIITAAALAYVNTAAAPKQHSHAEHDNAFVAFADTLRHSIKHTLDDLTRGPPQPPTPFLFLGLSSGQTLLYNLRTRSFSAFTIPPPPPRAPITAEAAAAHQQETEYKQALGDAPDASTPTPALAVASLSVVPAPAPPALVCVYAAYDARARAVLGDDSSEEDAVTTMLVHAAEMRTLSEATQGAGNVGGIGTISSCDRVTLFDVLTRCHRELPVTVPSHAPTPAAADADSGNGKKGKTAAAATPAPSVFARWWAAAATHQGFVVSGAGKSTAGEGPLVCVCDASGVVLSVSEGATVSSAGAAALPGDVAEEEECMGVVDVGYWCAWVGVDADGAVEEATGEDEFEVVEAEGAVVSAAAVAEVAHAIGLAPTAADASNDGHALLCHTGCVHTPVVVAVGTGTFQRAHAYAHATAADQAAPAQASVSSVTLADTAADALTEGAAVLPMRDISHTSERAAPSTITPLAPEALALALACPHPALPLCPLALALTLRRLPPSSAMTVVAAATAVARVLQRRAAMDTLAREESPSHCDPAVSEHADAASTANVVDDLAGPSSTHDSYGKEVNSFDFVAAGGEEVLTTEALLAAYQSQASMPDADATAGADADVVAAEDTVDSIHAMPEPVSLNVDVVSVPPSRFPWVQLHPHIAPEVAKAAVTLLAAAPAVPAPAPASSPSTASHTSMTSAAPKSPASEASLSAFLSDDASPRTQAPAAALRADVRSPSTASSASDMSLPSPPPTLRGNMDHRAALLGGAVTQSPSPPEERSREARASGATRDAQRIMSENRRVASRNVEKAREVAEKSEELAAGGLSFADKAKMLRKQQEKSSWFW